MKMHSCAKWSTFCRRYFYQKHQCVKGYDIGFVIKCMADMIAFNFISKTIHIHSLSARLIGTRKAIMVLAYKAILCQVPSNNALDAYDQLVIFVYLQYLQILWGTSAKLFAL